MDQSDYKRAQQIISALQYQYNGMRQETYKTVHDDIGSTLSTASIKAKILTDMVTDHLHKHHLQEIHKLIKETMDQVTTLNKKLKSVWIPQGMDTFFESLGKDFKMIEEKFPIQIHFEVIDKKNLKKQSLVTLGIMHDFVQEYIRNAISRLVKILTITVHIDSQKIEWSFTDSSPSKPTSEVFVHLNEKIAPASGKFSIHDSKSILTFPNQGTT